MCDVPPTAPLLSGAPLLSDTLWRNHDGEHKETDHFQQQPDCSSFSVDASDSLSKKSFVRVPDNDVPEALGLKLPYSLPATSSASSGVGCVFVRVSSGTSSSRAPPQKAFAAATAAARP